MPVQSKLAPRRNQAAALLAGAGACGLALTPSWLPNAFAVTGPCSRVSAGADLAKVSTASSQSRTDASGIATFGASATAAAAFALNSSRRSVGLRGTVATRGDKMAILAARAIQRNGANDESLRELASISEKLLSKNQEAVSEFSAFAASRGFNEVSPMAQAGSSPDAQLRWAANNAAAMLLSYAVTLQPANAVDQVNYSDFLEQVQRGEVEMVRVQNDLLTAQYTSKDGSRHEVNLIPNAMVEDSLFNQLADKKVDVVMQSTNAQGGSPLDFLQRFAGPIAWLIAGLLFLFGGVGFGPGGAAGPGGNPFELGKAKAKVFKEGDMKVKFGDVAGCDGAKQELVEVVDFLKNTSRYSDLGAKIPKGCLLVGPPGTGKTLLAKAVAGEAGVPFFSISASEFVEIFAGIGASRVRDLFDQAKKSAPCIIFIDEIDAVGRQRSAGFGQGNDEREQTVNQLLTEMDGFEANNGVVVIAATNRADILDQALVRPGRFDRQIQVDPPDVQGRTEILKVHAREKSLAPGVDLAAIARQTPGMSGADLANLLNEGAIVAARQNKSEIDQDDIANALERIVIGLEKKDAVMSEKKRNLVAYHEAGHAVLGALMNDFDIVAKISIVPRGPAGGVTIFMPSEERLNSGLYSKEFLENRMCVALGGRIAEEIINGKDNVTTGASNDFQQCTQVAKAMVTQLGMSQVVGQRIVGASQGGGGGPFMGRDFMGQGAPPVSQKVKTMVDGEVKRIVDEQYERGMYLLKSNRYLLDNLAKMLLDQEKVGGEELMKLVNKAAAEGKLVSNETPKIAVAAFVGERADDLVCGKKDRCVHPAKPLMFACGDCPRKGGMTSSDSVCSAAAFVGVADDNVLSKKDRCLHPDKPLLLACGDCPRRGGKIASEPLAAAALVGELVDEDGLTSTICSKKDRCVHPDKPLMFACGDCPRKGGKASCEPLAAAAFVGEMAPSSSSLGKKDRCLHPDKPLMFACADCPRKGGKIGGCFAGAQSSSRSTETARLVARLGLRTYDMDSSEECLSNKVEREVASLASQASTGSIFSAGLISSVSAQVIAAIASTAAPLPAYADDVPAMPSFGAPMQQQQQMQASPMRVSGRVTYSRLLEFVEEGSVSRLDLYDLGRTAMVQVKVGEREQQLVCDLPGATTGLIEKLQSKGVLIDVHQPEKPNQFLNILGDVAFPLLLIGGLLFLRSRGPGNGGIPGFGQQGKAKVMVQPQTGVKFEDVAGIDEAKEELTEIVDFLKAPERFVRVGAKIPKGVLLTGPPGTGKTLMAKALAGESGVPFIQSSASEFIELFVGVGASRVRDIFKQAKEKAPCIVFIDEIDAIGRQRGAGMGGGNDEREQTLNQILTEMDGFEGNTGVIVVAATNRSDILDSALLRPGRFDRRVQVGLPDVKGREQILKVHIRNKKLAEDITLGDIAKRTAGFSGADLENLMNESAILTARRNKKAMTMDEINDATDRVIAGLEGRALADNAGKKLIAYHEAGHALVGTLLPYHDPVNKVTLVPRGQAKGLTWFTPNEDQSLLSANTLKARIAGALGGRAAEQLVFGESQVTTGAGGDLQQVERMARAMVTQFGMSDVGSIAIDDGGFMGPNYSEELSSNIDEAIRSISDECYLNALTLLMKHRDCLDRIADELVEAETISGDRLREIVSSYVEVPEKLAAV